MGAKATVAAMVVERMASFIMFDSGVMLWLTELKNYEYELVVRVQISVYNHQARIR